MRICKPIQKVLNRFGITDEVPSILRLLEGKKTDNLPRLYLECGDKDHVCGQSNRITHEKLEAMGVKHSFSIYNGAHSPLFWRGSLKRMMTIISQTLNPDFVVSGNFAFTDSQYVRRIWTYG